MKKLCSLALAALLALGLTACGAGQDPAPAKDVDLAAFYDDVAAQYDWEGYMTDMTDEMVDAYYPGLRNLEAKQFLAKTPLMSAVVSEVVLMECGSAEDAVAAADILTKRVNDQADGGAWYPASMEAWESAQVVTNGNYVSLLAYAEDQQGLNDTYNALFAD